MSLPEWAYRLANISPGLAGGIAAGVLLLFIVLDAYASGDDVPGNTPREIAMSWTRWAGRPLGIPFTGAPIPFALGALTGHWFHPGVFPNLVGGTKGLLVVLACALLLGIGTGLAARMRGGGGGSPDWGARRWSEVVAIAGVLLGALVWPVGG